MQICSLQAQGGCAVQIAGVVIAAEVKRRVRSPDFAASEKRLRHPLSESFRALYADQELMLSDNVRNSLAIN
jgi:hypothetical protein